MITSDLLSHVMERVACCLMRLEVDSQIVVCLAPQVPRDGHIRDVYVRSFGIGKDNEIRPL